jgi:hypothetical protein
MDIDSRGEFRNTERSFGQRTLLQTGEADVNWINFRRAVAAATRRGFKSSRPDVNYIGGAD